MKKFIVTIYYPDDTSDDEVFYLDSAVTPDEYESSLSDKVVEWSSNNGLIYDELDWEFIGPVL